MNLGIRAPIALGLVSLLLTARWCVAGVAPIVALTFHPSQPILVVGRSGSFGIRASVGSTNEVRVPSGLRRITGIAFPREAKWIAAVGGEPGGAGGVEFRSWPVVGEGAGEPRRLMTEGSDLMMSVAVSPDGRTVAYGGMDRTIRLVRSEGEVERFHLQRVLTGHSGPVLALAFHPGGQWLVSAGVDRTLRVWEVSSGREVRSLAYHTESVTSLVFFRAPDSTAEASGRFYCASGSVDGTIRVWQPEIGRMVRTIRRGGAGVLGLAGAPSVAGFWSAGADGWIRRYGAEDDVVVSERRIANDWVYGIALSRSGVEETVATGDRAGNVRVTEAAR